jgi:adenylylsulfate kinase
MAKILVFGLSGSGKTTLSDKIAEQLGFARINADKVRSEANDWDFSAVGRLRQAQRVAEKSNALGAVVIDMIAPLKLHRSIIKADKVIWMNTKQESKYKDTDSLFEPPSNADIVITDFEYDVADIIAKLGIV